MESLSSQLKSDSSSHRLPTVSASQVLQRLQSTTRSPICTGLPELDSLLRGRSPNDAIGLDGAGLVRGKITEIYGPPGVGKTAFALQAVANVLRNNERVIWIDCGTPLVKTRLTNLYKRSEETDNVETDDKSTQDPLAGFDYTYCPTLAHILALILHLRPSFPSEKTSLIVLDSLSTPIDTAYHRSRDFQDPQHYSANPNVTPRKSEALRWASSRKYAILGQLSSALSKIALLHNLAVLVTSQTMTRVRPGQGAILLPAIGGAEWTSNISTQLVLFRDFPPSNIRFRRDKASANAKVGVANNANEVVDGVSTTTREDWLRLRYVGIIKLNNRLSNAEGTFDTVVPFTLDPQTARLRQLEMPSDGAIIPIPSSPSKSRKRRRVDDEDGRGGVGDSDDDEDEYGWGVEDELAAEGLVDE